MTSDEHPDSDDAVDETGTATADAAPDATEAGEETPQKLNLEVKIWDKSSCQRHILVTIPREDIDRYFEKNFSELVTKSAIHGFRPGRAPRKLVESKFKKEVADQVKSELLMDSLGQVSEDYELSPISEPEFNAAAVVLPEKGSMTYEFDIEVRPEFDLPEWKGLKVNRPIREFSDADVDKQLHNILAHHGRLAPFEGAAESGDYVTLNLTFKDGETVLSSVSEETIRIRPVLSFRDGRVEGFDKLMSGVRGGEARNGQVTLSEDAPREELRGKTIDATFDVLEVKKLELPELTPEFLQKLGDFDSEEDLRTAIRESLLRRLEYAQQQQARQQVTAALTVSADWELPPELLRRQSRRELERAVLELRRSGFSEAEIRAHSNELRQNSQESTARALKEHFILERLAEAENIVETEDDYTDEIKLIARQSGESPRRVRAGLEKRGLMDALRNQIIERKAIELVLQHAKFKDTPYELEAVLEEAVDQSAGGNDEADELIPEAKFAGEPEASPEMGPREPGARDPGARGGEERRNR